MINIIRKFLIKHDPFLKPPAISENLHQSLEKPSVSGLHQPLEKPSVSENLHQPLEKKEWQTP